MVRSEEELFAFEWMTAQKHGDPASRDHAGFAALNDDTLWLQMLRSESEMVPRSVGRSRGAEGGLCLASIRFVPMSRSVRDVVRFFKGFRVVGHVISVFVPHQRMDVRIAVTPNCAVACIRKRLQAADIENGRTTVSEQTKTKHRLIETNDLWDSCLVCFAIFVVVNPPLVKKSAFVGVEQGVLLGAVHIDLAAAWCSEEAAKMHESVPAQQSFTVTCVFQQALR